MRDGKITQEELDNAKAKYNGSFALGMEDPSRTATYASNILMKCPSKYVNNEIKVVQEASVMKK
jgi:predicted Zn-dependent peptidase